jgi:hypothetical protein
MRRRWRPYFLVPAIVLGMVLLCLGIVLLWLRVSDG